MNDGGKKMSKRIDSNLTKRSLINYLENSTRDEIIKTIRVINDFSGNKYPYILNVTGSKFDLVYQLSFDRLITQEILFRAIQRNQKSEKRTTPTKRVLSELAKIDDEDVYKVQRYGELLDPNDSRADRTDLSILNLDIPIELQLKRVKNFYKLKEDPSSGITNLPILFSGPSGARKTNLN